MTPFEFGRRAATQIKVAALLPGVKLQPHQQRIADAGNEYESRQLLYHGLGSGKTLSALAKAETAGVPYTFVGPASLRVNAQKEREKWTDQKIPSDVYSYNAMASGQGPESTDSLIVDECFPAGTIVDGVPIENIKPGACVESFNHHTGATEKRLVTRTAQKLADAIAVVTLQNGDQLICTPNHPLFTSRGYVPVDGLLPTDAVARLVDGNRQFKYTSDSRRIPARANAPSVATRRESGAGYANNGQMFSAEAHLQSVQPVLRTALHRIQNQEDVLDGLRESWACDSYDRHDESLPGADACADACRESDAQRGDSPKGFRDDAGGRAQAAAARRERPRTDTARDGSRSSTGLVDISDRYDQQGPGLPTSLQSGCRKPGTQNRRGGRRSFAPDDSATGARPEENSLLEFVGVDRIEIHERGSGPEFERLCPQGVVYDLTVEENHNFFVDSYLVHNSQNLRNASSQRTKAVTELADTASHVSLLSGTPIVNDPGDLAPLISILTRKNITPTEFDKRYVGQEPVSPGFFGWLKGIKPGERPVLQRAGELKDLLAGHVDYQPQPDVGIDKTDESYTVPMGPEQTSLYQGFWGRLPFLLRWKLQNDFPLSKQELGNLSAFLSGPRQVSLSTLPFMKGNKDPYKAFEQSPKLQKALELAQQTLKDPNARAVAFSNFIDAGLTPYQAALQRAGISAGIFHGGLNDAQRKAMVDQYNAGKLRMLLLGPSGGEGISLKGTRLLQVLDPHWNTARTSQAIGRGIRFDSHQDLPEEDRNIKVQRFQSELPPDLWSRFWRHLLQTKPDNEKNAPGSDAYLTQLAQHKDQLNNQFLDLLKEVGTQQD